MPSPSLTICACGAIVPDPRPWSAIYERLACEHSPEWIARWRLLDRARRWVRYVGRRAPRRTVRARVRFVRFHVAEISKPAAKQKRRKPARGKGAEPPGGESNTPPAIPSG
jgi:hypothetical protein